LVVLVLVAGACGGKDPDSDASTDGTDSPATSALENTAITTPAEGEPTSGGTLQYGLGGETSGWDPTRDRWGTAGLEVARAFYEPLATYDADHDVVPYLAESITPNGDFTVWTITPRAEVTFHDGSPVDARAIADNLQAHLDSPLTSPALKPVDQIAVVDDTVEVRMTSPWAHFPHILTSQGGNVALPATLGTDEGKREPVGTGPFEFVEWVPDDHLSVAAYDGYWQDGYPRLDGVEFRVLDDNATRLASFDTGDLDIMATAVPEQILDLQDRAEAGELQMWLDRTSETLENMTLLNVDEPPFDDIRARQAVAYATDEQLLIDTVHAGLFQPANGLFQPGSDWYTGVEFPEYDPERARQLVEEYEAEKGPLEFQLDGTSTVEDVEIRQALAAQWAEVGIDAELENLDAATTYVSVLGRDFQAANFSLFTAQHPDSDWMFLHSSTRPSEGQLGLNVAGITDERLDGALDAARASNDPNEQRQLYATVNEVLAEEIPIIFLWHSLTALIAQPDVHGVTDLALPDGGEGLGLFGVQHPLHAIWLDR
jgi:peptide/nickel transport system substrate-binding protein